MNNTIDCIGMACPLPVIKAKEALAAFTEDGTLTVKVDNDTAVQNLTRLAGNYGLKVSSEKKGDREYEVTIDVKADAVKNAKAVSNEEFRCDMPAEGKKVVVISADTMGNGDENLGRKLMKAFIFALKSQDEVPDKIIFYNRGAFLTTEDPDTISDLKDLAEAGATIMTCGTCLDFYGLKEKLQVGIVSNMYDIVAAQMGASLIIRP